jgi:hypothetical protein
MCEAPINSPLSSVPVLHSISPFVFQRRGGQTIVPHIETFLRRAAEKHRLM